MVRMGAGGVATFAVVRGGFTTVAVIKGGGTTKVAIRLEMRGAILGAFVRRRINRWEISLVGNSRY
jgi:hypothetical protein